MSLAFDTTDMNPRSRSSHVQIADISPESSDLFAEKAKTIPDLIALANVLDTLTAVANAFSSTQKMNDSRGFLNAAGSELDDIIDLLVERHLNVMSRLADARGVTKRQADDRSCALLRWDLECDQEATDIAVGAVRKKLPQRF